MKQSTNQVVVAINECYSATAKPEAQDLMNLYSTIGEVIAHEENSSFVAELAKDITKNCAGVKAGSKDTSKAMLGNVRPPVGKLRQVLQGSSPPRWKPRILMRFHLHRLTQIFSGNAYEKEFWRASQIGVRAKMY